MYELSTCTGMELATLGFHWSQQVKQSEDKWPIKSTKIPLAPPLLEKKRNSLFVPFPAPYYHNFLFLFLSIY
jgi:hypothetical protein